MPGRQASSIAATLHHNAARRHSDLATVNYYGAERSTAFTTYAELQEDAARIAEQLRWRFPVLREKGSRLVLLCRNHDLALFYIYAAALLGLVLVPLNVRWSVPELHHAVADCGAEVAICDRDLVGALEASPRLSAIIMLFSELHHHHHQLVPGRINTRRGLELLRHEDLVSQQPPPVCRPEAVGLLGVECCSDDVHCLIYTSGSTGEPKGVTLTHGNQLCQAKEKCRVAGYDERTVYLNLAPLFHIGGLNSTLAVTMAGGTHVFLSRMDMGQALDAVLYDHVNTLVVVPAILHALLTSRAVHQHPAALAGIRLVLVGGQSMPSRLQALASRLLPQARFIQTYACSEACSSITFLDLGHGSQLRQHQQEGAGGVPVTCVGYPALHAEVRVLDADGQPVNKAGIVGEIVTRGPHVMRGYWGKVELTGQALRGGWLHTGDLGSFDDAGRLHFRSRVADVIRSGGESVFALEVERVLESHPRVAHAAVFGLPDERLGERAVAAIVLMPQQHGKDDQRQQQQQQQEEGEKGPGQSGVSEAVARSPAELSSSALYRSIEGNTDPAIIEDIRAFCRERLSRYKCPRDFVFIESLPRSTTGKVIKGKLKRSFL